jgi:hypothetical protein
MKVSSSMMNNQTADEEIMMMKNAAAAGDDEAMKPNIHRSVTAGSSTEVAPHDKICDQAVKIQAPSDASNDTTNVATTMSSQHRQALAHLYHSSRRSRNFRSLPSSPSAITYAHVSDNQDVDEKDVSIYQVAQVEEGDSAVKAADVEWSFDIASLVDDCSSVPSSFDGEESFVDNDNIFRIETDCWQTNEKNSSSEPVLMGGSVEGGSNKRLRTT